MKSKEIVNKKKIVLVAMSNIHFLRWVKSISSETYDLYWFDILNRGYCKDLNNITQIIDWQKRKVPYITGEYFLKKKTPKTYKLVEPFLQVTIEEEFTRIIDEIKPDLVHSFEMQLCSYRLLASLKKHKNINWIYSCWGTDLFYYRNLKNHKKKLIKTLARIDYIHTDCLRDYEIAKELGFKGGFSGVIPGGGGYSKKKVKKYITPFDSRNIILVKGYEHNFGRGLNIVKALEKIQTKLHDYKVIIFACHKPVINYIVKKNIPFITLTREELKHEEVLELMGKTKIYIGNSISDGMPNTLIEALIMGVIPIQSNPGNVTEELVEEGQNGYLINEPENIDYIKNKIIKALNESDRLIHMHKINLDLLHTKFSEKLVSEKIQNLYEKVLN